jgi:hypothetical protein
MAIIRYEVGYDRTNILGSGSTFFLVYSGRSKEKAFEQFQKPGMTWMSRTVFENGVLHRTEYYNRYTGKWE